MLKEKHKCDICDNDAACKAGGMFLCHKHRSQWYRHHCFNDDTIYAPNEYVFYDDYAEIILKNAKCEEVGRALIDLDDVEKCKPYKWHIRQRNYVIATVPTGNKTSTIKIHLHRLVSGYDGKDLVIDHINRNPLDNRKENLRIVNNQTNIANHPMPGVVLVPSGRYQAHVTRHYKSIYIGTYDTYEEALEARKTFVAEYDANDPHRVSIPVVPFGGGAINAH